MVSLEKAQKLDRKNLIQLVGFIVVFGIFVALISALLSNFIDPETNKYIQGLLLHENQALVIYFLFVIVATVVVPIPTLPIDLVLFSIFDPVTVIIVRVFAGIAGGSIGYYLSSNYGRPLLRRWLSKNNYKVVETLSNTFSWRQFFIITMIPVINAELMAYVGGLGKLGYRKTIFTLFIGLAYRVIFVAVIVASG